MRIGLTLVLVTFAAQLSWAQVEPAASGGATNPDSDMYMETPPAVNPVAYPIEFASKDRSSYLNAGVEVSGSYDSNLASGQAGSAVSDTNFSVSPSISLQLASGHHSETFSYNPSFMFYQQNSSLNSFNQGASISISDQLTQRLSVDVSDSLYRTSNIFNSSYLFSQGGVSGTTPVSPATVIYPFASQLSNSVSGIVSYQYSRDGMIGGGASSSELHYFGDTSNQFQYDATSYGGSAFFSRRISERQYLGVNYQYARSTTDSGYGPSLVQTHSPLPFYSFYFAKNVSMSLTGGLQLVHVSLSSTTSPQNSWQPSGAVSFGWSGERSSFSASAARTTTVGAGLYGAFVSTTIGGVAGFKLSRTWSANANVSYDDIYNTIPQPTFYYNGDSLGEGVSLGHNLRDNLSFGVSFSRLHEYYPGISVLYLNPNYYSISGSISYALKRPLGR